MDKTFELKSLKIAGLGADVKYRIVESDEEIVNENDFHVKATRQVSVELASLVNDDLAKIVAEIFDYEKDKIIPTGISFAGKDDNKGIVISGYFNTKFGNVKFKTPRIKYLLCDNLICGELTAFVERIVVETQAYLEGKTEELKPFGE